MGSCVESKWNEPGNASRQMNPVHETNVCRVRDDDLVSAIDRRQQYVEYSGQAPSRDHAVALTAIGNPGHSGHMASRNLPKMPLPDKRQVAVVRIPGRTFACARYGFRIRWNVDVEILQS